MDLGEFGSVVISSLKGLTPLLKYWSFRTLVPPSRWLWVRNLTVLNFSWTERIVCGYSLITFAVMTLKQQESSSWILNWFLRWRFRIVFIVIKSLLISIVIGSFTKIADYLPWFSFVSINYILIGKWMIIRLFLLRLSHSLSWNITLVQIILCLIWF